MKPDFNWIFCGDWQLNVRSHEVGYDFSCDSGFEY